MNGKCGGLEIEFDLASESQGIWKISKCKGPCDILTPGEISQVSERVSSFTLLFMTAGSDSSSRFLDFIWTCPVPSLRDFSQPN